MNFTKYVIFSKMQLARYIRYIVNHYILTTRSILSRMYVSLNVWRLHRMSLLPRAIQTDDTHMAVLFLSSVFPKIMEWQIIFSQLSQHLNISFNRTFIVVWNLWDYWLSVLWYLSFVRCVKHALNIVIVIPCKLYVGR